MAVPDADHLYMSAAPELHPEPAESTRSTPGTSVQPGAERVLSELSHALWRQREQITRLIYRLEVQQLVLASGRTHWIAMSTEEVDDAIEDVRRHERSRIGLVEDLSPLLGTAPDASLRDLVAAVDAPWDLVLSEHHTEFLRLANEAEEAARSNRDLLHHGLTDVRDLLESFGSSPETTYGRPASATAAPDSAVLVDREA